MPDFDPSAPPSYNSMQQQMGLMPPMLQPPPPVIFPGQVSAAMAQGGSGAAFMTATTQMAGGMPMAGAPMMNPSPMMGGMPMMGAMPMMGMQPPMMGSMPMMGMQQPGNMYGAGPSFNYMAPPPNLYAPTTPMPPPVYAGQAAFMGPSRFVAPPNPSSMFNTPYMARIEQKAMGEDLMLARETAYAGGIGDRLMGNTLMGVLGATGAGALAARFGAGSGAFKTATALGGALGFIGSEFSGIGRGFQNLYANTLGANAINQRAMAGGIEELSRGFVNYGADLGPAGAGFSHHAAMDAASGLRSMARSKSFQQETGGRFNQQDLLKITQESARNDMMGGVQTSTQMVGRVREIAKSLSAFMQLAQEPDVQRALQTMGQLRSSGLNLSETMQAVSQGRAFARMAGTSFSEIAAQAGGMGGAAFQNVGLTQGLGMQTGMMNYGLARSAQNAGVFSPQMMAMVGGAQGLAGMNTAFSANMLQMPMMAPGVMSTAGGVNATALQNLTSGNVNMFQQTSNAASALSAMTNRQGVGGLGMAIAMQPLVQDTIGRQLQAQGPFAQRNFEDKNIFGMMRQMNQRGSGGFAVVGQALGMSPQQAAARAMELASPSHFQRQREQIEATRLDEGELERQQRDAMAPSRLDTIYRSLGVYGEGSRGARDIGRTFRRDILAEHSHSHFTASTDAELRRERAALRDPRFYESMRRTADISSRQGERAMGYMDAADVARGEGFTGGTGLATFLGAGGDYGRGTSARLRDMTEGGRLMGLVTSSSAGEYDRAVNRMRSTFGADETRAIQSAMETSLTRRITAGLGGGPGGRAAFNMVSDVATLGGFIPGSPQIGARQITASDIRQDFIRAATRSGRMSEEQAAEYFQQHAGEVVQSTSLGMQASMTDDERRDLEDQARRMQGAGSGRGTFIENVRREASQTRSKYLGSDDAELQDAALRQMENIRGSGRAGSAQNAASRQYIFAAGAIAARQRVVGRTSEEGMRLQRRLDEMKAEAERRGVNVTGSDIGQQVIGAANRMSEGPAADAARAFVATNAADPTRSGASVLDAAGGLEGESRTQRMKERIAGGYAALAQGSDSFADALRRAGAQDPTKFDPTKIRNELKRLSEEDIRRMSPERQRQVRAIIAGDENITAAGQAALTSLGYGTGTAAENARKRYANKGTLSRAWAYLTSGGEEGYVQRALARSTNADRRAGEQGADVDETEAEAERSGVAGEGATMIEAARELKQAAQALQSIARTGDLDRAVTGDE